MRLFAAIAMSLALAAGSAFAADAKKEPSAAQKAQQDKMTACNKEAGDKKGDDRKSFMSNCLKAKPAAADKKMTPQQEKMGACNKQAADQKLAGDKRKAFMSTCLKG